MDARLSVARDEFLTRIAVGGHRIVLPAEGFISILISTIFELARSAISGDR